MTLIKWIKNKVNKMADKFSLLFENENSYNFEKPIFIWGCPRSGTTLMQHLLSSSPEIITARKEEIGLNGYNVKEGTKNWWDVFGATRGEMKSDVKSSHIKEIKKRYVRYLGLANTNKRLLDKTTRMTLWVDKVEKIFPDAFHIHMIRNGLAVANSILFKYRYSERAKDQKFRERIIPFGPYTEEIEEYFYKDIVEFVARQWVLLVSKGRSWRHLLKDRYIEVFYDDLTERPKEVLQSVCNKIEIDSNKIDIDIDIRSSNYKYKRNNFETNTYTMQNSINEEDIPKLMFMKEKMEEIGYKFDIQTQDVDKSL